MFAKEHDDEENMFDICIKVEYFAVFLNVYSMWMFLRQCGYYHGHHIMGASLHFNMLEYLSGCAWFWNLDRVLVY